uniref:Putative secreted peptide n=1 Tax=Anopheles braziliensis TaxID=58242 RepID=A0A2M3ZR13_9DIPT
MTTMTTPVSARMRSTVGVLLGVAAAAFRRHSLPVPRRYAGRSGKGSSKMGAGAASYRSPSPVMLALELVLKVELFWPREGPIGAPA